MDQSAASEALVVEPSATMAFDIAREAARLFAKRGYDATSVREITEAAGVTKPTLYYHFGSKEGLAHALLNRPLEDLCHRLDDILGHDGSARDCLASLTATHFLFCCENPDRARFLHALVFGPLGSSLATDVLCFSERLEGYLERGVNRLVAESSLHPARAGAFLKALRGLLVIHVMDHLYRGDELEPGLACQLVDDLLAGFAVPIASRRDAS